MEKLDYRWFKPDGSRFTWVETLQAGVRLCLEGRAPIKIAEDVFSVLIEVLGELTEERAEEIVRSYEEKER